MQFLSLPKKVAIWYLAIFVVGLAVYKLIWPAAPLIRPDSYMYLEEAMDLSDGSYDVMPYRTFPYLLLLLVTGSVPVPSQLLFYVQMGMHMALIWLGGAVLYRAGASNRVIIAFALLLFLPPFADTAAGVVPHLMAEFFLSIALTAFYFAIRDSRRSLMVLAALSFAVAGATRPGFQLAGPAVAIVLLAPSVIAWLKKQRSAGFPHQVSSAVMLVAFSAIMVLGYSAYNKFRFDYFGLTPLFGHNLAVRATPFYERIEDPEIRDLLLSARNKRYDSGSEPGRAVWDVHAEMMRGVGNSRVALVKKLQPLMVKVLRAEKFDLLREVARSFAAFWVPKADFGWGFRVGKWWEEWDRTLITFKDFRFGPNRTPSIVKRISTLLEAGVMLAFFVTFFLCAGAFCTALWFGELKGRVEPATAVIYAANAMIVFYNALVNCIVDQGDLHQRLSTEAAIVLCIFLGFVMLKRLRGPAHDEHSPAVGATTWHDGLKTS